MKYLRLIFGLHLKIALFFMLTIECLNVRFLFLRNDFFKNVDLSRISISQKSVFKMFYVYADLCLASHF